VIYFTHASYLELVVSLLFLVVSTALSIVLVPAYGTHGAAFALMVAWIIACLTFMVLGRRWYRLPIDLVALGVIPALAILFVIAAHVAERLLPVPSIRLVVDAVIFVAVSVFAIRQFDLLSAPPAHIPAEGLTVS
jgi:O-antigen/teichoic acid export membrane protein